MARRFLGAVEPQIAAVQGVLEQPLSDFENANIGPREPVAPAGELAAQGPASPPEPGRRSISFYLLVAGLFADALWHWLTLSRTARGTSVISNFLTVFVIALAILVLVQHRRNRVRPAQQKLAIATLVGLGLVFYGTIVGVGLWVAVRTGSTKATVDVVPDLRIAEEINIGATLVLGLLGLAILFFDRPESQEPRSIVP